MRDSLGGLGGSPQSVGITAPKVNCIDNCRFFQDPPERGRTTAQV